MPPRNHKQWSSAPQVEAISSACYNSFEIHQQEQDKIFSKVWVPMCHKSEMPNAGNFRTTQIAGVNIIAVNNGDTIKTYLNTGKFNTPSGTMTRVEFLMNDYKELYTEVKHGGMVWTTLNENPTQSVEEWTAGAFDCIADAIDT